MYLIFCKLYKIILLSILNTIAIRMSIFEIKYVLKFEIFILSLFLINIYLTNLMYIIYIF